MSNWGLTKCTAFSFNVILCNNSQWRTFQKAEDENGNFPQDTPASVEEIWGQKKKHFFREMVYFIKERFASKHKKTAT